MTPCCKCGYEFTDGELMSLACFGGKGNRTLCRDCADELVPESDF